MSCSTVKVERRLSPWVGLPIVLVLFGCLFVLQLQIDRVRERGVTNRLIDDMMYFPSGRMLSPIAGQFRLLLADYAWLRAIQYYAYHLVRDHNYEWFGHIARIITQMDPNFVEAYRFCSLIMSWDMNQPGAAIDFLREGMSHNQLAWELPFQAAFTAYVKMKDFPTAASYFAIAARMPDVWTIVPRWAAIASKKAGNLDLATEIWREIWLKPGNDKLRDVARRQLLDILKEELSELQSAVDQYEAEFGRPAQHLDQVVGAGYLEQVPIEPFGGHYELRGGRVLSSSVELTRVLIAQLQQLVNRYRREHRRLPGELKALIQAGYLNEMPVEPLGGQFRLENGRVATTSTLP